MPCVILSLFSREQTTARAQCVKMCLCVCVFANHVYTMDLVVFHSLHGSEKKKHRGHINPNKLTHFLTSAQQFSRLKGDETGNWSGPVNFSDDGSLKPARNGRKRYLVPRVTDCTTPLESTESELE